MVASDIKWTVHKWTQEKTPVFEWKKVWDDEAGEYITKQVIVGYDWDDPEDIGNYSCTNVNFILKTDDKSNSVEFDITPSTEIYRGDVISVRCNDIVPSGFKTGVVQNITENTDKTKHIVAYDPSILLKNVKYKRIMNGIFIPKVLIRNPDPSGNLRTISNYVDTELSNKFLTSWATMQPNLPPKIVDHTSTYLTTDHTYENPSGGLGQTTVHPLDTSKTLPDLLISDLSLYDAYYKFLNSICGFNVWYNAVQEGSTKCRLDYGFVRQKMDEPQYANETLTYTKGILIDINREYILSTKCLESEQNETVDEVIVYSNSNQLQGSYINDLVAYPSKSVTYRVEGNYSRDELDWIASRIYNDTNNYDKSYVITFPPGTIRFKDGEYFGGKITDLLVYGLGDQTITPVMPFKGGDDIDQRVLQADSVWQIEEVNINDQGTYVTVGSSYLTIMEILGNKLTQVTTGIDPVIEEFSYDSGEITLDPGIHFNILSKPLKIPGNSNGDITVQTFITPLNETNSSPLREEVMKQYLFQTDPIALKPNEEATIEFGPMDEIPAKYNYADVKITWQVGCGDEVNAYSYCNELMEYNFKTTYDMYASVNNTITALTAVTTATTCAQFTAIHDTFETHVKDQFDYNEPNSMFGGVKDGVDYYSQLHYYLTSAGVVLDWLQLSGHFATEPIKTIMCIDDMCDAETLPCNDLVNLTESLITIFNNAYDLIFTSAYNYFDDKCDKCTGSEINNNDPYSTTGRDACDIITTLDAFKDDFDQFKSEYEILQGYIESRCGSIAFECSECNNCLNNRELWVSTCETCKIGCDTTLNNDLSSCNDLLVTSEREECIRLAKATHYECIDNCTHHYRDCEKYASKYKPSSCDTICNSPYDTCDSLDDYYDDLIVLCQDFRTVIADFLEFVDDIARRKLIYYELYEWMTFFYNGTGTCVQDYNDDCASYDAAVSSGIALLPTDENTTIVQNKYDDKTGVCGDNTATLCDGYTSSDVPNSFKVYVCDYFDTVETEVCAGTYTNVVTLKNRMTTKYNAIKTKFVDSIVVDGRNYCIDKANDFDVTFDPEFVLDRTHASFPTWLTVDESQMELMTSDTSHVYINNAERYSTLNQEFGIKAWSGVLPIYNKGYLPRSLLNLKIRNNSDCAFMYLDNLRINIIFHYYTDAPFIANNTNYAELFVSDFAEEATYPVYMYTDNYDETILKRMAYVVKHDPLTNTHYQDVIQFADLPATHFGDIQVYKSTSNLDEYSKFYYDRNQNDSRFFAKIIIPTLVAQDNAFVNVWVEPTTNPNDPDTEFKIHVANFPEKDTEHHIPIQSLHDNIDLIQYYNVISGDFDIVNYDDEIYGYSSDIVVSIPRYAIESVYYETLPYTYKSSASLIPYVEISSKNLDEAPTLTINDYATSFTIFNGGTLKFSDNLNNAPDGIRSKEVFKFGLTDDKINKFSITNKSKAKFRFVINYSIYKDVHSENDDKSQG